MPTPKTPALTTSVRPVGTQSTVDQVATEIRRALLTGALVPGQVFSMADLAADLQVSHIPVREALRRFEAQGLVTMRPGRAATVAPITAAEIEDVHRLWIMICSDVVARACERYTDADFDGIQEALDAFAALPQQSDDAFAWHQEFHMRLLRPGASPWDERLLDMLWFVMERAVRVAYRGMAAIAGDTDPGQHAYKLHVPLLRAARRRDPVRLQNELRKHHERNMRLLIAALAETEGATATAAS